jgi:flagellar basal body-associated protein FliL
MSDEKKEAPRAEAGKGKEGAEGEAKSAKKGLNKKLLIIAGIVVADIALMAGLGLFIVGKMKKAGPDPAVEALRKHEEEARKAREEVTRIGHVLAKPLPFTVNITGSDGESHFLKCAINLEWEAAHSADAGGGGGHGAAPGLDPTGQEIEKRMPKITDIIIDILTSQSYEDLMKPAGKQRIKEAIVREINAILPEPAPPAEGEGKPHGEAEGHDAHGGGHQGTEGKIRNAFFTEFIVQ